LGADTVDVPAVLVFLVVERDEDHGTDWCCVESVHAVKDDAEKECARIEGTHRWREEGEDPDEEPADWCLCCGRDWRVYEFPLKGAAAGGAA